MEDSARTQKVISQAAQWSFEGDCSLLAWMQDLSQVIEQRASATSDALQQLAVNVNRTAIALDNSANSLTALQYTQFVESRCHDDDETLTNTADTHVKVLSTSTDQPKSTNEVLETFLQKNLQMLNNCHEKYSLDFEDSDEDESVTTNNCIYQPKNPYNDALLPHIYGSKLWKEHWHVGLCDGSNEYSGDEASDAFSESSRSSTADNESYESNTANLSEWASSTSIPIEHKHPQVVAQNVPTITTTPPQNRRIPITQHIPSNDDSDTCSTTSRSTANNPQSRQRGEHDLFTAALRHDTPVTSTSASSSPQQQQYAPSTLRNQRNVVQLPSVLPPFFDATPPTDIFDEAASTKQSSNRTSDTIPQKSADVHGKVKPVNLFDDDDFNSFMTDVVEKPQINAVQPAQIPVPATRNLPTKKETGATAKQVPIATALDMFTDTLNIQKPVESQPTGRMNIENATGVKQRKPVNLFVSPENSPPNDSLFSSAIINEKKGADVVQKATKPNISAKLLFDDDEDDDDFLNVFGSKKLSLPQSSAGRTLLFDDDSGEKTPSTMQSSRLASDLFAYTQPADKEASSISTLQRQETNKSTASGGIKENANSVGKQKDSTALSKVDLFADFEDESATLTSSKVGVKPQTLESNAVKPNNINFGNDLFGDEDNDDLDDLFKKKSRNQQSTKTIRDRPLEKDPNIAEPTKLNSKENIKQTESLFENEDDLFSNPFAQEDLKGSNGIASNSATKIVDPPQIDLPSNNLQNTTVPTQNVFKSATLFAGDFDDESDDLFGGKPNTKSVRNENIEEGVLTSLRQQRESKSPLHAARTACNLKSVEDLNQQRSIFEDVMENEESDLFKIDKEITKDTIEEKSDPMRSNYSASTAEEPESALFVETGATVPKQQTIAAVYGNASNTVVTVKQISKEEYLTGKMRQESEDKFAGGQNTKTSRSSSVAESTKHEGNSSVAEVARNRLELESDLASSEEIITSESMLQPAQQSANAAADLGVQPLLSTRADAKNHEYPSIFLDEPPDDDDFFTTLSSSTHPLSVSKLTLDLESDFYEPALPATPNAALTVSSKATNQTQKDVNNKQQPSSSDYGGLRLFCEIPPDDDGDDFSFAVSTRYSAENSVASQRLHSVFYDDFSETLEAVQQIKEKQTTTPALFHDEPPTDEDHFDIMRKIGQIEPQANNVEEERSFLDSTKQISSARNDSFKSEKEKNGTQSLANASMPSNDVTDQAVQKEDSENLSTAGKMRSPAGKLQIPNIKINVQALLPGGGGMQSFKKSPTTGEVAKAMETPTTIPESLAEASKELPRASSPLPTTSAEPAANENILPSVCKTRVRAPVGRRPSTRRARQENYRQSLLAEQADLKDDDGALAQTNAPSSSLQHQAKEKAIASSTQTLSSQPKTDQITVPSTFQKPSGGVFKTPHANLLEEDDSQNNLLFRSASSNKPAYISDINTPNLLMQRKSTEQAVVPVSRPVQAAARNQATYAKGFTVNSDDESDDLFKGTKPITAASQFNTADNGKSITTKPSNITAITNATKSLFDTPPNEDSDEDLFKGSKSAAKAKTTQTTKSLTATTTTTAVTNVIARPKATTASVVGGKLDSIFGSDDEDDDFLSNLKSKKKPMPTMLKAASAGSAVKPATQSGGGLFSDMESDEDDLFGGGKSKTKQDAIKTKKVAYATKTHLANAATSENPASLADNPLADLLNP
ncbi:WASH complex subunit 2 [Rhagoletis pomonella]|uniref:WASH complex subunit 2 n=1 Tax=Rhagoletis pomonella TaxID=28610 RepID=UPI001785B3B8|nr:WASH complex subunit 2 [Rhagoletis pomonella]